MCCCGKPVINGELGYRWNDPNAPEGVHPVNPPSLGENDTLLYDEPGRCGWVDSHSYHYRVVKRYSTTLLGVRHGGGDEWLRVSGAKPFLATLSALDSAGRYWVLNALYHAWSDGKSTGQHGEAARWQLAVMNGRVKKRKVRGEDRVKVWIEGA